MTLPRIGRKSQAQSLFSVVPPSPRLDLPHRPLLTICEVASAMSIGRKKVIQMLVRGDLAGFRLGEGPKGEWRVDRTGLEKYIADRILQTRREIEGGRS